MDKGDEAKSKIKKKDDKTECKPMGIFEYALCGTMDLDDESIKMLESIFSVEEETEE